MSNWTGTPYPLVSPRQKFSEIFLSIKISTNSCFSRFRCGIFKKKIIFFGLPGSFTYPRVRDGAGGNVQFRKLCVFLLFPLFWGCCAGIVSETSPLDGADIEGNSVRARTRKNSERKLAPRGQEAPRTPGGAHTTHHTDYNTPRLPQETTPHSRGHPLHFLTQNSGRIGWSKILALFSSRKAIKPNQKLSHKSRFK